MPSPSFDLAAAHRWFAIELNNQAWDLIESPDRPADAMAKLLSAAHASRYHWLQVGTVVNHLRAEVLVAAAYLTAGEPALSLTYAQRAVEWCGQSGAEATAFDRACAWGGVACARARLGQHDEARRQYALALEHIARGDDAEERALFEKLYPSP